MASINPRCRTVLRVLSVTALAAGLGLVFASEASAQRRVSKPKRIQVVRPEVHGSLGPGFGFGMRLDIALVKDGFLKKVEDEFALSPGFEFFFFDFHRHHDFDDDHHGHSGLAFSPHVVAQWNFYLHDAWSVFPELGIAFTVGDDFSYHHHHHGGGRNDHVHFYVDPVVGGGARWHFSDRGALVFRLVWPYGFQFGVTF